MATKTLSVGDNQFRIAGQAVPVRAAAMHYWRLDRDLWDGILDQIKAMGFTAVSTYIPWEAHEIERGTFDFGGVDPSLDIEAFLGMCKARGLYAIVRPGPQINGEMNWFGFPRRIVVDPELHALSASGSKVVLTQVPRPIPALSYAAPKFFDETALWYDAICPILARHVHPRGGLIAAQVDNEMAFFFNVNAYAADFSPASVAGYRDFLRERYGTVEALGETYGRGFAAFEQVEPPRRFEAKAAKDIPYYSDWVEYRERYLVDSLAKLAGMMRARGLQDLPLFHNYPHPLGAGGPDSGFTTPFNLTALEGKLDFVGHDLYFRKELYANLKTTVSYAVGTSRYPYAPELFTGTWPWFLNPGGDQDEEFVSKAVLMHGLKGFSRYTFVERDRWLNSPIRQDGRVREARGAMYGRINAMAERHRFTELRQQAGVLLLANRGYDRLEAASVLLSFPGDFLETPVSLPGYPNKLYVSEETLGLRQPVQIAKADWFMGCYRGLTDAGFGFLLSDTTLDPARWRERKALVLSAFEYLDAALAHALVAYAEAGGVVVLGPLVPHLDERMRGDETLRSALGDAEGQPVLVEGAAAGTSHRVGQGRIVHLTHLAHPAQAFEAALQGLDLPRPRKNDVRLDMAIHRAPGEADRMVVFVCNPTAEAIGAEVDLGVALRSVTDIWTERPVTAEGSRLSDHLPPYTVNIYECRT